MIHSNSRFAALSTLCVCHFGDVTSYQVRTNICGMCAFVMVNSLDPGPFHSLILSCYIWEIIY